MRELIEIAFEIEVDWNNIKNSGAQEALNQMKCISDIHAQHGTTLQAILSSGVF